MADWDVIGPVRTEEEEGYEEEGYFEDDEYFYSDSEADYYPNSFDSQRITASSFQMSAVRLNDFLSAIEQKLPRSKRDDRLAYRHKTGAGIRKGLLNTGNDIEDALAMYDERDVIYNPEELREKNADDLIPERERTRANIMGGCGSKNIIITKVKKGTLKKGKAAKSDIITSKIDTDPKHYWDHVSHQLMEDGQFVQGKYDTFHETALKERANLGIGQSPEMNSLYCFWCFYLREHFDQEMYDEFLKLAKEDAAGGSHYPLECFFRFCSYGLEIKWNENVFKDFQVEAMEDYQKKSFYGLEKLQAFLLNQKHTFEIPVRPDIAKLLSTFPTLKSFRERQEQMNRREKKSSRSQSDKIHQEKPRFVTERKVQPNPPVVQPKKQPTAEKTNDAKQPIKIERKNSGRVQCEQPQPQRNGQRRNGPRRTNLEWKFGKAQPASAPMDSPMRKRW